MKKEVFKKIVIFIALLLILFVVLVCLKNNSNEFEDTVSYDGKTYVLLEYNMDIFTYNFNSNVYYEEDIIHPVSHSKWDFVYFNGDLFVLDSQVDEVTKYYADDDNYDWFIVFEKDDSLVRVPISIDDMELKYLYNMENVERSKTIVFDDIKQFVDITKESKDGFVQALINLVYYEDSWYWKTEVMTDNDEEYVIDLPESLCNKVFDLLGEV